MPNQQIKHPYGISLLARDTPQNRKIWGDDVGHVDVAATVCTADGQCPYYDYHADADHAGALQTPIHLLIASFRDQLCPRTLHNAFQHAENPKRVFIRVIEQTLAGSDLVDDAGCFDRYCTDYNKNCHEFQSQVRIVHVDASKSKGPTDARSKLSAMISWDYIHRNDHEKLDFQPVGLHDFCMQTDSHMDFSDNFDTELINMFHRTQNDYAVLSTYVADISQNNQDVRVVPNLCMVSFTSSIRNWGTKECRLLQRPKLTNAMWGAGLSFHRCHAELVVPVDPYLDQVFDGEEGSRGIRFFTHGYDVYTPDRVLVTHDYKKHQSNPVVHSWGRGRGKKLERDVWNFTQDIEKERPNLSIFGTDRVNLLLGIGPKNYTDEEHLKELEMIRYGRFGIGTKRSLAQAVEFTGIDLFGRKMVKNKCGNLVWVPYEKSSDYGVREIYSRGLTGGHAEPPETAVAAQDVPAAPRRTTSLSSSALGHSVETPDIDSLVPLSGAMLMLLVVYFFTLRRSNTKRERHRN